MKHLASKVAVVTGAASGIGFGMATAFAEENMHLVLADVEEDKLDAVAKEFSDRGTKVITAVADVSQPSAVDALADLAWREFGAAHVLCNNAGVAENNLATWELTLEDWEWVLGVNLMGVVHGVRSFVPRMLELDEPCHIVNTASIGGLVAGLALPAYSVSKHGVVALSECLYNDLARRGSQVSVSVLCPGWIKTGIGESDRNRAAKPELNEALQRSREAFKRSIGSGLEPRVVGDIVVDGIRTDQFYLYTHPEWNSAIEDRFTAIMDGRKPASTYLPRH